MTYRLRSLLFAVCVVALSGCGSVSMVSQDDSLRYASAYEDDDRTLGRYDLDVLTDSPQRLSVMLHFERPAEDVFEYLLTEVDAYDDSITEVMFDNSGSEDPGHRGVGSARICTFDNGKVLVEPLLVYEPYRFYAYTVAPERSTFGLPIRDVLMFYSFEESEAGTLVTVRAHYTAKSKIASPVIGSVFNRTVKKTFARAAERFGGTLIDPS